MKRFFLLISAFLLSFSFFNLGHSYKIDRTPMSTKRAEAKRQQKLPRITANSFTRKRIKNKNIYMRSRRPKRFGTRIYEKRKLTRFRLKKKKISRKYSARKFGASSFKRDLQKIRTSAKKSHKKSYRAYSIRKRHIYIPKTTK